MVKKFEELLFETPACNDFRMLTNGNWVAYSTKAGEDGGAIRGTGISIRAALEDLREKLI